MSAASAARRVNPGLAITVLESGPFPSYGVCGIPYLLGGEVSQPESLIAHPPEEYRSRRRIDLRLGTRIQHVDPDAHTVTTDGETLDYDRLVWAAGARPVMPRVPGTSLDCVATVRTLHEAIALLDRLPRVVRATVVGAGYVGLEVAEALVRRGVAVTVCDRLPRVMGTVDTEMARHAEEEVRRHAELRLGHDLAGIEHGPQGTAVVLVGPDGPVRVAADLVVVAVGVAPEVGLLTPHGVATGPGGALLVDEQQRTSLPDVFAAGDCATVHHRLLGRPAYVPLGPAANRAGRVAGTVAAGGHATFEGVLGTAVVKVFDLAVAHTGLTLEQCRDAGVEAQATDVTARSRAKYFPGAEPLHVRLVHEPGGRLLGGQVAGSDGAALRVDTIAAALHGGLTIDDLACMDLAYAPPFSPVTDPVAQAAQAALRARSARELDQVPV